MRYSETRVSGEGAAPHAPLPHRGCERTRLIRSIAARLARSSIEVVLFHYDGDQPWSHRRQCPHEVAFKTKIVDLVEDVLAGNKIRVLLPPGSPPPIPRTPAQTRAALARLIPIVPFYSIEAWLYQNTAVAHAHCTSIDHHNHQAAIDAWASDRTLLDEIVKPKDNAAYCLKPKDGLHERLAAEGYPMQAVYDARRSLHDTIERLRGCTALMSALDALAA